MYKVGADGAGYIWSVFEGREEEWRHSVAPISEDKLAELLQAADDVLDVPHVENHQHSEELVAPSIDPENLTDDNIDEFEKEVSLAPSIRLDNSGLLFSFPLESIFSLFFLKVEATFQRAVQENIKDDNVVLEVNSLR